MIPESFHRLGKKLLGLWQHLPLKGMGVLSAALPMVAVVARVVGNQNRQRMEMAVTRHFEMVERMGELLPLMLNAETGLRGQAQLRTDRQPQTSELPQEMTEPSRIVRQSGFVSGSLQIDSLYSLGGFSSTAAFPPGQARYQNEQFLCVQRF